MNTIALPHSAARHVPWVWAKRIGSFLQATGIFIPILFLALMFVQDPFSDAGDYDYDEGINLMKTTLYEQQYTLYDEVWNDQPPLFTVLLAQWFAVAGKSTATARILVALFSALLVWSFYLVAHDAVTTLSAMGATLLLVLSQFYLRLSGAVMIGLPALALAVTSIMLLVKSKERRWLLPLSALVMALALETKLFVAVLLPALALHLLVGEAPAGAPFAWRRGMGRLLLWLLVTGVAFLALSVYFNALNITMLLTTHFGAQTRDQALFADGNQKFITDFLKLHPVYLAVAALGVLYAVRQRQRAFLLPLAWFLTVLTAFVFHRPLWYHHVMLLTIPLAWLGAFALEAWVRGTDQLLGKSLVQRLWRTAFLAASAVALVAALLTYPTPLTQRLDEQSKLYRPLYIWEMVHQLQADAQAKPGFVFTDRPFYAFQAGLPVTPPIASISRKRMEAGILTQADMLNALTQYKPEYVILQRFTDDYGPAVMDEINRHYTMVLEIAPGRYYRRTE